MDYSTSRSKLPYYKLIKNLLCIITRPCDSIIDVGSNGVDLLSGLNCKEKFSLDICTPILSKNILSIKQNFFDFNPLRTFDIVTCFQVLEHIKDVKAFAQKLFSMGRIIFVSVPYRWPKDACADHINDPIDAEKLISWFDNEPLYLQVFSNIIIAIFLNGNYSDITYLDNSKYREFTKYDIDIDLQIPSKSYFPKNFSQEYKNLMIAYKPNLSKFKDYSPEQLASEAITRNDYLSKEGYNKELLYIGMDLFPFYLDPYGHPLFYKELVRYLLNNGKIEEAKLLLNDYSLPSRKMMSISWAQILFQRLGLEFDLVL